MGRALILMRNQILRFGFSNPSGETPLIERLPKFSRFGTVFPRQLKLTFRQSAHKCDGLFPSKRAGAATERDRLCHLLQSYFFKLGQQFLTHLLDEALPLFRELLAF